MHVFMHVRLYMFLILVPNTRLCQITQVNHKAEWQNYTSIVETYHYLTPSPAHSKNDKILFFQTLPAVGVAVLYVKAWVLGDTMGVFR